jgi:hypothetical protein
MNKLVWLSGFLVGLGLGISGTALYYLWIGRG